MMLLCEPRLVESTNSIIVMNDAMPLLSLLGQLNSVCGL